MNRAALLKDEQQVTLPVQRTLTPVSHYSRIDPDANLRMRTPTSKPLALAPLPGFADGVGLDDGSFITRPLVIGHKDGHAGHGAMSWALAKVVGLVAVGMMLSGVARRLRR